MRPEKLAKLSPADVEGLDDVPGTAGEELLGVALEEDPPAAAVLLTLPLSLRLRSLGPVADDVDGELRPVETLAAAAAAARAATEVAPEVLPLPPVTRRWRSPGKLPFSLTRSDHLGSTSNIGLASSH